jgi:hypothetical protein
MMARDPAWGPVLAAAARGDMPLLHVGQSAATVAAQFSGRQPVYLATPYSGVVLDASGQWDYGRSVGAMMDAGRAAGDLMALGVTAFAPVAQSCVMVHARGQFRGTARGGVEWSNGIDPMDSAAWAVWCQPMLNVCGAVVVPDLAGWDQSRGIWAEVQFAIERCLPVFVYGGAA